MAAAPPLPAPTTLRQGHHATLELLDDNDEPLLLYTVPSRPPTERWASCTEGAEFRLRLHNLHARHRTQHALWCRFFVDGNKVATHLVCGGNRTLVQDVRVREVPNSTGRGPPQSVCQPLIFAKPTITEEEEEGGGGGGGGGADIEKLGRVHVEVWDAIPRARPKVVSLRTTDTAAFKTEMTEKQAVKAAAFASTTSFGNRERVKPATKVSLFRKGNRLLETLEIRYGNQSKLMMMGVSPGYFVRVQDEIECIDLVAIEEEEEREKAKKTRGGGEQGGGARKRVKTEVKQESAVVDLTE